MPLFRPFTARHDRRCATMLVVASAAMCTAGCASTPAHPNIDSLYGRTARTVHIDRNPIILVPGILGSKLLDPESGKVVWGAFRGDFANPETPEGARLVALPMNPALTLGALRDGVAPNGALDTFRISVLGLPVELGAYLSIMNTLCLGGYRDEDLVRSGELCCVEDASTCFQFDYDWRRDNVESARALGEFIQAKRREVQADYAHRYGIPNYDVRFDIVAHSMGALVARYYLEYGGQDLPENGSPPLPNWEGAGYVDKVILIGPPNAGSVQALEYMVNGRDFERAAPRYEAALLGTMPSLYQLLPRGRHGPLVEKGRHGRRIDDLCDPDLWIRMKWGLADPQQDRVLRMLMPDVGQSGERRRIALDHLARCLDRAKRFAAALDAPASPPPGLSLYLVVGDAIRTPALVEVDPGNGRIRTREHAPGDGVVLRSSALLDERVGGTWSPLLVSPIAWNRVTFLSSQHLAMTADPAFSDNMLFFLLEQGR